MDEEEAVGRVSHQLTQTVFPAPLEEITAELLRTGRWDGELSTPSATARRSWWRAGGPCSATNWPAAGDLETNNDITSAERAQDALREAEAELAHVTRADDGGADGVDRARGESATRDRGTSAAAGERWLAAKPPNLEKARRALERIVNDGKRAGEVIKRIRALVMKASRRRRTGWTSTKRSSRSSRSRSSCVATTCLLETQLAERPAARAR